MPIASIAIARRGITVPTVRGVTNGVDHDGQRPQPGADRR